jgi:hypothetical protein
MGFELVNKELRIGSTFKLHNTVRMSFEARTILIYVIYLVANQSPSDETVVIKQSYEKIFYLNLNLLHLI